MLGRRRRQGEGSGRAVTGRRPATAALLGAAAAALLLGVSGLSPASAQGAAAVPGAPTNLGVQRGACGEPATVTWDAPAAPTDPVYRYQIGARNTDAAALPADWVLSDVSGWSPWSKQWTETSEQLGAGTWGAYDMGVTAVGADGAGGPTEWITVPPCRPAGVTDLVAAFVAPDRVRVTWTPPPGAGSAFWKYQVYLNLPGWSAWEEDAATASVEVAVPASGGVLPQVRVATVGWQAGPATWFCDPPSRFCIDG